MSYSSFSGGRGLSPTSLLQFLHTHNLIMAKRIPANLANLRKLYGFTTTNVYTTTNPKTLKNGKVSDRPTIVLHLEPVTFGACPAAGTCAALCLNKAGNPLYLDNKLPRRAKRSHAFHYHRNDFLQLMMLEAARQRSKGYVGARNNGTSDHDWERITVNLTADLIGLITGLVPSFRITDPGNYTVVAVMTAMGFELYDYTKRIDRDWTLAAAHGYHLTLSWGGKHDDVVFDVAAEHRLNVAAPVYGVKKSKPVPEAITAPNGTTYATIDGDVTDWRRDDGYEGQPRVVALRLKRTPGQTERLARAFCIA
jgi:hypothetical protein